MVDVDREERLNGVYIFVVSLGLEKEESKDSYQAAAA